MHKKYQDYSWLRDYIVLILVIGGVYLLFLGHRPLTVPDEARYGEIPREMLAMHDWITPHLNGIIYFEKPILFYWLQALALKIFGINQFGVRFITMLMGLIGVLMTYTSARILFSRRVAWLSSIILASSGFYFGMSHFATIDMTMSTFLSGALFCFLLMNTVENKTARHIFCYAMYVFAALAVLTKGLIGILLPGLVFFLYILIFNEWKKLKTYKIFTGVILFLIIALPWHILVSLKNPGFFHQYFIEQQFMRFFTPMAHREQPIYFMPAVLVIGFLPWTVFLIQAVKHSWTKWSQRHAVKLSLYLLIWAAAIFIFFWCSHSQLSPYILPVFPPLAILIGIYFDRHIKHGKSLGISIGFLILLLLGIGTLIAIFKIPTLRHLANPAHDMWLLKITLAIGAIGTLLAVVIYFAKGLKAGMIALALITALTMISLNFTYPPLDTREVKSLALKIQPYLTPTTEVVALNGYYQDLPFYLQRKIIIVGWQGELKYGMTHQKNLRWVINQQTLWQRWQQGKRMFIIMGIHDYERLKNIHPMFLVGETPRNVAVTNKRLTVS